MFPLNMHSWASHLLIVYHGLIFTFPQVGINMTESLWQS